MQIKEIEIHNFRGIRRQTIELSPNINVFVGVNGAGKSTVLDAIAISLSWLVARIQKADTQGMSIPDESIKNGTDYASIQLKVKEIHQSYMWSNVEYRLGYPANKTNSMQELNKLAYHFQKQYKEKRQLPMIVYYPINRVAKGIVDIKGSESISQLDLYDNALGTKANFQAFFEWFRLQDDIINEEWKNLVTKVPYYDMIQSSINQGQELKIVTKTIEKFIPEYSNLRVTRIPTPHMLVEKNAETISLNQLSDGEKNMIAMIGDIARRLSMANPTMDNPLEGDGIVMIDEVDLHLHPSWQRLIVSKLVEVFPNTQFIVTTHSAQILSHVKAESIFLLQQNQDNIDIIKPTESYGRSSDRQLEDILGVEARPAEIKDELHQLFKLIQEQKLDEARRLMAKLEDVIEGREPELIKANVLIKRKEILRK